MKRPFPRQRRLVLGSLLLGTIAAAFLVEDEAPTPAIRPQLPPGMPLRAAATAGVAPAPQPAAPDADNEIADKQECIDPFRSKTWYIAPPPPPPVKPTAPPLPFQFLGQLVEAEGTRVFVSHQGRQLIIKAGDVIAGTYAVEEVAVGRVVFLYLPLKERQVLATGTS